jgi:CysZ protein
VTQGFHYLWRGLRMLNTPGIRRFVALPLLVNFLLFSTLIGVSLRQFNHWIERLLAWLPDFLGFLEWLLWPLAVILLLVVVMYSFSMLANLIAAPFNGLLAEKVETLLSGAPVADSGGVAGALADAPRAIAKELGKILYYLPRALLVLILSFFAGPVAPFLWFALGAWMMALEYVDYPMDNHKKSLKDVRTALHRRRAQSYGFGGGVMLATMIPVLNLIIMPAAVCGATIYWVEGLKREELESLTSDV